MSGWWAGGSPAGAGAPVVAEGALVDERKGKPRASVGAAVVPPRWLTEDFRGPPAFFLSGIGRVNPLFVDEDFERNAKESSRHAFVARSYEATAPESPGKSGSSGYESNPCSDEATRWETETRSTPRRAAASRAARRQAHSVRTSRRRPRGEQQEAEGDRDEGHARAPLAPIPEGKVGGLAPRTMDPASIHAFVRRSGSDVPIEAGRKAEGRGDDEEEEEASDSTGGGGGAASNVVRRAPEVGRRRRPRGASGVGREAADSCSPASTASSSPASSSSSGSGKRLLRRADAVKEALWGAGEGVHRQGGGRRLPRCDAADPERSSTEIPRASSGSLSSSAASSVSSGFTVPPQRRKLLRPHQDARTPPGGEEAKRWEEVAELERSEGLSSPRRGSLSETELLDVVVAKSASLAVEVGDPRPSKASSRGPRPPTPRRDSETVTNCGACAPMCRPEAGALRAEDVFEKLRNLELSARSALEAPEDEGCEFRSPWENYYGAAATAAVALPIARKTKEGVTIFQVSKGPPSIAHSRCFGSNDHLDFTLDMPRAERLMQQIAAAKRRRCWGRWAAATLALAFFLLSVVAVSMLYTRGKRVFGPL